MNKLIKAVSWFFPVKVEKAHSAVTPGLEVCVENGRYVLNSMNANYSFGHLHRVFRLAFREGGVASHPPSDVLVLGLGAGSVVSILRDEYGLSCPVTGIDSDPMVLALGNKYFNLGKYAGLEIVCADAIEYLLDTKKWFGMIVVDLFVDREVPARFETAAFIALLKARLAPGATMFFNKITHAGDNPRALQGKLEEAFGKTGVTRTDNNLVFRATGAG